MSRSSDVRIIERAVDRLAHYLGLIRDDELAEYDLLVTPGPCHVLKRGCSRLTVEREVLVNQIRMYLELHSPETIIVGTHYDCGREGPDGKDRRKLMENLASTIEGLKANPKIKGHRIYGLWTEVDESRTTSARTLSLDQVYHQIRDLDREQVNATPKSQ